MDWDVVQVVERLLCKPEALSSKSSPTKKQKKPSPQWTFPEHPV
jgi:hypothetical protein